MSDLWLFIFFALAVGITALFVYLEMEERQRGVNTGEMLLWFFLSMILLLTFWIVNDGSRGAPCNIDKLAVGKEYRITAIDERTNDVGFVLTTDQSSRNIFWEEGFRKLVFIHKDRLSMKVPLSEARRISVSKYRGQKNYVVE